MKEPLRSLGDVITDSAAQGLVLDRDLESVLARGRTLAEERWNATA